VTVNDFELLFSSNTTAEKK